jgi:phage gpG-like protein
VAANPATRAQKLLADAAARLRDLTPITNVLAQDVNAATIDAFRGQRSAVDGKPWTPLAESTIRKRRNKRKGAIKMLMDTGRMRSATNAKGTRTGFLISSSTVYSAAQNFGTRFIPRRPFLPVVEAAGGFEFPRTGPAGRLRDRIAKAVRAYVTTGVIR